MAITGLTPQGHRVVEEIERRAEKYTTEHKPMEAFLSTDSAARKGVPMASGALDYFPAAWAEIARLSQVGNDKHNPGEELHHARGKSMDHADCIMRHLTERGIMDTDGFLHDVKVAWRALAMLQEALEARGAPLARGARLPEETQDVCDLPEGYLTSPPKNYETCDCKNCVLYREWVKSNS